MRTRQNPERDPGVEPQALPPEDRIRRLRDLIGAARGTDPDGKPRATRRALLLAERRKARRLRRT